MTTKEKMILQLCELKEKYGATAVKISFETEDLNDFELLTALEIANKSGVELLVKLGGGEALVDIKAAKKLDASYILGPMIESDFVLGKYLAMCDKVIGDESVDYLINIETEDACKNIASIIDVPNIDLLTGVVIGRTDLARSFKTDSVEDDCILEACESVFKVLKKSGIKCLLGGGISPSTIPFLDKLGELIDGFETRKVVFSDCSKARENLKSAIELALEFEVNWYVNKKEYYMSRAIEDDSKIDGLNKVLGQA